MKINKRSLIWSLLAGSIVWLTFSIPIGYIPNDVIIKEPVFVFLYQIFQAPCTILYTLGMYLVLVDQGTRSWEEIGSSFIFRIFVTLLLTGAVSFFICTGVGIVVMSEIIWPSVSFSLLLFVIFSSLTSSFRLAEILFFTVGKAEEEEKEETVFGPTESFYKIGELYPNFPN